MPQKITVDKVIDHNIFANTEVIGYDAMMKPKKKFSPGQLIGSIYSWIIGNDGNLYYLIYTDPQDYANFNPTFVKDVYGQLSLPDLPDILKKIEEQKKQEQIATEGILGYYFKKYLPYIVGGVVIAIVFPAIYKSVKK